MSRFQDAFKLAKENKKLLKKYLEKKDLHISKILLIDEKWLKYRNIEILVLDFDGVLASHGEPKPNFLVQNWLKNISKILGENNIFILTNKPTNTRLKYFNKHFPDITFINSTRKKPYPDGLNKVKEITKVDCCKIALVDDRLLMGVLAAILAKVKPVWVYKPFKNYLKNPIQELTFSFLRKIDFVLVKIL